MRPTPARIALLRLLREVEPRPFQGLDSLKGLATLGTGDNACTVSELLFDGHGDFNFWPGGRWDPTPAALFGPCLVGGFPDSMRWRRACSTQECGPHLGDSGGDPVRPGGLTPVRLTCGVLHVYISVVRGLLGG